MHRRALKLAALLVAFAPVIPALAAPKAAWPPKPAKKPPASASASIEATPSASVVEEPTATTTASAPPVIAAPTSSIPVSPLTPRPDEAPPVKGASSAKPAASYDALMAEIAALRARVAAVGNAVWKSRLAVTFRARGSHAKIASAKLLLDGAQVWASPKGFAAEDDVAIFDGGVAPGPHAITWEIERRDDRDETFRTIDKTTATIVVPNGKRLEIQTRLEDDSSMGGDFPGDQEGTYDLRLKMKAKAK